MKQALSKKLVESGVCADKKQADALIMTGKVLVNDVPARAGMMISEKDAIRLKDLLPYASKGGLKLQGALDRFKLSVRGKVCLDAGASTGGFTDCLIQNGAQKVYAVDVGYGQLTGALRQNGRVVNLEKTNISDPLLLSLDPRPVFATCDLSYLSLRDAVPVYRDILGGRGEMLALVKPLFEIDDSIARRSGQIEKGAYEPLLNRLCGDLNKVKDARVVNVCESPVTGNNGTLEFFFYLTFGADTEATDLRFAITRSVQAALSLTPYEKAGDLTLGQV